VDVMAGKRRSPAARSVSSVIGAGPAPAIIERVVAQQLEADVEPTPGGTPQGHPGGGFRSKCNTNPVSVGDHSRKEIAARAGVTYEVLRTWRTERAFKNQVTQNTKALLAYAHEKYVKAQALARKQHLVEMLNRPAGDILRRSTDLFVT